MTFTFIFSPFHNNKDLKMREETVVLANSHFSQNNSEQNSRKRSLDRLDNQQLKKRKLEKEEITPLIIAHRTTSPLADEFSRLPEDQQVAGWVIKFMNQMMVWIHIQTTLGSNKEKESIITNALENSLELIPPHYPELRDVCREYAKRNTKAFEDYVDKRHSTNKFAESFVDSLVKDVTGQFC